MPDRHSDEILKRLMALHPKVIDLSLDRMYQILAKLGHPERKLPPVIHAAGTNGKGSLLAYLKAILEAAGYSVHMYTSPHLVRFSERIVLNGDVISEPKLSEYLLACEEINGPDLITYFEVTTAAALQAFSENPADVLLLETGLGGRLDATNVIDDPAAVALTPISHDHEQFLGSDLGGIAGEKAGIIKSGAPTIFGPQSQIALDVLQEKARLKSVTPYAHGEKWSCQRIDSAHWQYDGGDLSGVYPLPALNGPHQIPNAGTALAVLENLPQFKITTDHIVQGLGAVEWPARMQRLVRGNLVRRVPTSTQIWLDGGHNAAAGEQIAKCFKDWQEDEDIPTYLVSGMLNTKDQLSYYRHLQPVVDKAIMVPILGEEASTPENMLAEIGRNAGINCETAPTVEEAVDMLMPLLMRTPCRLLISGSLYLAGQVLRTNG